MFITLIFSIAFSFPERPIPSMTKGHLCSVKDPHFDGYRYRAKIVYCRREVEPELKQQIYQNYGVPQNCRKNFTIDHMIPLSIGGSNSIQNLWPEHKRIKEERINFETEVFEMVRDGEIQQDAAIQMVLHEKINFNNQQIRDRIIRDCNL